MIARYGLEDPPVGKPAPFHAHVDRRGAGARAKAIIAGHSVQCAQFGADPACPADEPVVSAVAGEGGAR